MRAKKEEGSKQVTGTDYGNVLDMYTNEKTGERVEMCWVQPNTAFPPSLDESGGEELFVVDGSIRLGEKGEEYTKWGWLRFPPDNKDDNQRSLLQAGSQGAKVYRKTGHLTEKALAMEKIQISEDS